MPFFRVIILISLLSTTRLMSFGIGGIFSFGFSWQQSKKEDSDWSFENLGPEFFKGLLFPGRIFLKL